MHNLKLFPLGSIVLPEGKMKLRIFEPRYKRLVSEVTQGDSCFCICLFDGQKKRPQDKLSHYGTKVRIVDFETLPDGLLGLTVVGLQRVKLETISTEFDGLRNADVTPITNWPLQQIGVQDQFLVDRLNDIYRQFPELGELYPHRFFDDLTWVCQRWLELLPLDNDEFDAICQQPSVEHVVGHVFNVVEKIRLE